MFYRNTVLTLTACCLLLGSTQVHACLWDRDTAAAELNPVWPDYEAIAWHDRVMAAVLVYPPMYRVYKQQHPLMRGAIFLILGGFAFGAAGYTVSAFRGRNYHTPKTEVLKHAPADYEEIRV